MQNLNFNPPNHHISHIPVPKNKRVHILAVENDIISMNFLQSQVAKLGYSIITASSGREAISMLSIHHEKIDVILMNQEIPVLNGLETMKHIKENPALKSIPVIMIANGNNGIEEGLNAGVYYYLMQPVIEDVLHAVLSSAVINVKKAKILANELRRHKAGFNLLQKSTYNFSTLSDAENLACFLSQSFSDPERVVTGLGEILINAIEHGNLGIGFEQKGALLQQDNWRDEIERRQILPENINKKAKVTLARREDGIYVIITDQGAGFDWQSYININQDRAHERHGRGIAQSSMVCFDRLSYNEIGNQAIAFVKHPQHTNWA